MERINRNNQRELSSPLKYMTGISRGFWCWLTVFLGCPAYSFIEGFSLIAKLVNGYAEMPCLWKGLSTPCAFNVPDYTSEMKLRRLL